MELEIFSHVRRQEFLAAFLIAVNIVAIVGENKKKLMSCDKVVTLTYGLRLRRSRYISYMYSACVQSKYNCDKYLTQVIIFISGLTQLHHHRN